MKLSYHCPNTVADTKTFYIIDGHAQIFRAYFAPFRDLSSPTGEPTKATYVFTQWLLNLIETRQPHYLAMAIRAEVTPVADGKTLNEQLARVRPHFFFSPPRTWAFRSRSTRTIRPSLRS